MERLATLLKAILAVVQGLEGHPRASAHILRDAILTFFTKHKLFPTGIYAEIPSVQDWALKHGQALKKLAPGFHGDDFMFTKIANRWTTGNDFCLIRLSPQELFWETIPTAVGRYQKTILYDVKSYHSRTESSFRISYNSHAHAC